MVSKEEWMGIDSGVKPKGDTDYICETGEVIDYSEKSLALPITIIEGSFAGWTGMLFSNKEANVWEDPKTKKSKVFWSIKNWAIVLGVEPDFKSGTAKFDNKYADFAGKKCIVHFITDYFENPDTGVKSAYGKPDKLLPLANKKTEDIAL